MIDTDKYEGHQPAPWRWVKPMGMKEWFLYAEQGNHSDLNHQGAGGIWLPDTFCRLGVGLDPTHRDEKSTYDLLQDAPLLLAEVKRLRGIIDYIRDTGRMERTYGPLLSIMEKVLTTEEYLEWRNEE